MDMCTFFFVLLRKSLERKWQNFNNSYQMSVHFLTWNLFEKYCYQNIFKG